MTSLVADWLIGHIATLGLSEDCEGYLLGRGTSHDTIKRLGLCEWTQAITRTPDNTFKERYGPRGEKLEGMVVIPIRGPSGTFLGIEARSRFEKKVTEFRVPEAGWNPFAINLPRVAEALWSGGSAWVAEGIYDLSALDWCIPATDATLATLRAGMSKNVVEFLARFCTNTVYMVYDNDETGRKATHGWMDATTGKHRPGALDLLKRAGVRAIDYPYRGKDPGDVWSKSGIRGLRRTFMGPGF